MSLTPVTIHLDDEERVLLQQYLSEKRDHFKSKGWRYTVAFLDRVLGELTVKPEEPTGLGAVVECDYDGKHGKAVYTGAGWTFYGDHLVDHSADWFAFDAVKVLSEGVQPDEQ